MSTPAGRRKRWRIIATDSDNLKLNVLTDTLREAGHCVFPVQDGRSALELAMSVSEIDLLVTNSRLGVMGGPELIRLVRHMRPRVRILHVVEKDDNSTPEDVLTLREPFTPSQLLTAVDKAT